MSSSGDNNNNNNNNNVALAAYCFDVLDAYLSEPARATPSVPSSVPAQDACVFVSWHRKGRLAGCKGVTAGPRPLGELLAYFAVDSASNDARFRPLRRRDFADLECGVSVLHSFEAARSVADWRVGTHGLTIEFRVGARRFHATYLPHVAPEQHWNVRQTIDSLIRKAGFDGPIDDALLASIRATRYQADKCELSYDDYLKFKQKQNE
jgi:uncharacterized protein (TIGR00296 family)